jgi:hypothetical protein
MRNGGEAVTRVFSTISRRVSRSLSMIMVLALPATSLPAAAQEWQLHLNWCIGNSDALGSVDCPDKYLSTYPECYASGGRKCLMGKAIQSAKDNDCANAFRLSLICQCHNVGARDKINAAGQDAVCSFLKDFCWWDFLILLTKSLSEWGERRGFLRLVIPLTPPLPL